MKTENEIDPKFVEEFLKFSRNVVEAPKLVPAPDEINLEVTPHDVVYTEDKVRLLHYKPLTTKQSKIPLVIAYALINRYHILDIHPKKSWVRNLLEQGIDVYMVDWGTPSKMDKYLDFDDYVNDYLDNCVEFVKDESSVDQISLQGYCTGGTLATAYCSLHPEKVKNFVATAPVIDGWRDTTVISNLAKHLDVDKMVETIGNKWLSDTPPIPGALFKQWIKDIYQDNLLIQDKMYVGGKHISLKKIKMPIFTQVAVGDHLVSPECSMPLHYAVGSEDKTLRVYPTGHVGMIASSLSQKKVLPELGQWLKERS